ncbi:hypothetical protein BC628DRAFT_1360838 [Trametes gibbosa]|nr:hypothetical protein BC628DRAFT_1360838 [Trametes gibbosa]
MVSFKAFVLLAAFVSVAAAAAVPQITAAPKGTYCNVALGASDVVLTSSFKSTEPSTYVRRDDTFTCPPELPVCR